MDNFVDFESFDLTESKTGLVYCLNTFGNYFEMKPLFDGTVSLKFQLYDSPRIETKIFEDISESVKFVDDFMSNTYWEERCVLKLPGEKPIIVEQKVGQPF